jgi:hypothetical protein
MCCGGIHFGVDCKVGQDCFLVDREGGAIAWNVISSIHTIFWHHVRLDLFQGWIDIFRLPSLILRDCSLVDDAKVIPLITEWL